MPGHKAKLAAFFTVIDEVRQMLLISVDFPKTNGNRANKSCYSRDKNAGKY